MTATMTRGTTHSLDTLGATIAYDVFANETSKLPPVMLIGSPMGASGFPTLASHLTDRTVITYDPRGVERSKVVDPLGESRPEQHADDIHRVIEAAAPGRPVDLFASSGGAVNALALVAAHPADIRTLIAHEPPLAGLVPDCASALAAARDVHDTYLRRGFGPAMAKFIQIVSFEGPITSAYFRQPDPDPRAFGLPTEDDGSRNDPLLGQNMIPSTHYEPDLAALRRAQTRIVIAAGETSGDTLARRGAEAIAQKLGTTLVIFPGGHDGFLGGEFGQHGDPDAFAAKLREVLGAT